MQKMLTHQSKGLHLDCVKFWTAEIVSALEYLHTTVGVLLILCLNLTIKAASIET